MDVAASAFAVVSLAIQLIESFEKINTLVRHVKESRDDITRLLESLHLLRWLLEDVQRIYESQTVLGQQNIPPPPPVIPLTLKRCHHELEQLQALVNKYRDGTAAGNRSKNVNLRERLRVGFKAKEIQEFETKISRHLNILQAILMVNHTQIQIHGSMVCTQIFEHVRRAPSTLQRLQHISSPFEKVGLFQQQIVSTSSAKDKDDDASTRSPSQARDPLQSEKRIYTMAFPKLGRGVDIVRGQRYGEIHASLSTYPVVENWGKVKDLISSGNVVGLQEAFRNGQAHPFLRNNEGSTLLHLAAQHLRPDVCRFLVNLGVKPKLDHYGWSPLRNALNESRFKAMRPYFRGKQLNPCISENRLTNPIEFGPDPTPHILDTYRILVEDGGCIDDFAPSWWTHAWRPWNPVTLLWMSKQGPNLFSGSDLTAFQELCTRQALAHCSEGCTGSLRLDWWPILEEVLGTVLTHDGRRDLESGKLFSLADLFDLSGYRLQIASYQKGKAFLNLLAHLNIDIQSYLDNEIAKYPRGLIRRDIFGGGSRLIVEDKGPQGWVLGWKVMYTPKVANDLTYGPKWGAEYLRKVEVCHWEELEEVEDEKGGKSATDGEKGGDLESRIVDLRPCKRVSTADLKIPGSWID